jgi:cob(I)alamin adenosyltransferase
MSLDKKQAIRDKLSAVRQDLLSLVESLEEGQWKAKVFSEEADWTVLDLLRHVTDSEASMTGLMELIRNGGEGVPADFDLQRWNARRVEKSRNKILVDLERELTTNRTRLLEFLDSLEDADWTKSGRHGSLRILSIEETLNLIADHESSHLEDMRRAIP